MSLTTKRIEYLIRLVDTDQFPWVGATSLNDAITKRMEAVTAKDKATKEHLASEIREYQKWKEVNTGTSVRLKKMLAQRQQAKQK